METCRRVGQSRESDHACCLARCRSHRGSPCPRHQGRGCELAGVYDLRRESAEVVAGRFGGRVYGDVAEALADPSVEAVAIATPTDTHVDYLVQAVAAGKEVFCEKPIDLSVARALECLDKIGPAADRVQIGFNRRFDKTFARLRERLAVGRDRQDRKPHHHQPRSGARRSATLATSGGILKDMAIHDFDMARFILGEEPVEVFATGSVLVDPAIGDVGDHDSVSVVMRTASGVQCQILNSRRCAYGYDQRIEAFGEKGSLRAENPLRDELRVNLADSTDARSELSTFFLDTLCRRLCGAVEQLFSPTSRRASRRPSPSATACARWNWPRPATARSPSAA